MNDADRLPIDPGHDPNLRLSDRERHAVSDFLRHQASEGRLTMIELEERLDQVYKARIRADLQGVAEGLPLPAPTSPAPPRAVPPDRVSSAPARHGRNRQDRSFESHLRVYLVFCVFFVLIWLVSGMGYFWPIWPILGWGVGIASHWARRSGDR